MEAFILENAYLAHWVIFGLFMLAGLNIPISEDLLIIAGGVLASTIVPENTWKLFTAIFLGAFLSDAIVFFMGRYLGPSLMNRPWFARVFKPHRVKKMQDYYAKWGMLTLFFGRFIPFGVRNCLFATAGMGKVCIAKFLIVDGIACLLSNSVLFTLSYFCGKSCSIWLKVANIVIFSAFLIAVFGFVWYKKSKTETN